jgi:hypothetical protein
MTSTPEATRREGAPYSQAVVLEPDSEEAQYFPDGTIDHIELKIEADSRHAAVSLLRAFGGPLQDKVLADWVGDPAAVPAAEWAAAYDKVHFPHVELQAAGAHGKDECEVTITAPSIAMAHHALRLSALPVFEEQILA